jgi:hypothetical protein
MASVSTVIQRYHERADKFGGSERRGISAEGRLVLFCCQGAIDDHTAGYVRTLIDSGIDWDRVLRLARRDRVLPLLSEGLNTTFQDHVPAPITAELKRQLLEITGVSLVLGSEVAAVIKLIEARGIRVLTFKGPALAVVAFGNPTARMFGDIDLIVAQNDFAACQEHFLANSYTIVEDYVFEKTFQREGTWAAIDLHGTITPRAFPCPLQFDDLWARREMVDVFGHEVPSLSIADHLLAHCLQTTHDRYQNRLSLAKLADIAGLLQRGIDIDWDHLLAMTDRLGMSRRLLIALGAVADLLACPLPPKVASLLDDRASLRRLSQFTGRGVLDQENRGITGFVERVAYHFRVHERNRDKLAQLRMVPFKIQQAWAKSTL